MGARFHVPAAMTVVVSLVMASLVAHGMFISHRSTLGSTFRPSRKRYSSLSDGCQVISEENSCQEWPSSETQTQQTQASAKSGKTNERHGSSRRDFLCLTASVALSGVSCLGCPVEGCAAASASQGAQSDAKVMNGSNNIPFSTRREYRQLTLPNGLRVLLVHDRDAVRASAALSIGGAGQFSDPDELPGLAHMMEHMVLSSSSVRSRFQRKSVSGNDFEEWLSDREGASNAFTAPDMVCFHFTCPPEIFGDALSRFSTLFYPESVEKVCRTESTLKREARRIDGELDFNNDASRAFYLLKSRANPDHPFSRFTAGSLETLEKRPGEVGIDVGSSLVDFFRHRYLPERSVLVVVGPAELRVLERWVGGFVGSLSRRHLGSGALYESPQLTNPYPEPFPENSDARPSQTILLRSKDDPLFNENIETLSFQWPLSLEYGNLNQSQEDEPAVTAALVGFFMSQILGRRGPGSLYLFLLRRGWVTSGIKGVPHITFPVDVSGFQIMKMEIGLSPEGFANRSAVIAAVYKTINSIARISPVNQPFRLPRELLVQYLNVATLHGYVLAPRPPDSRELAVDAQTFGIGMPRGVGVPGLWPLIPSIDDARFVDALTKHVASTLFTMSDPTKAIVIITASVKAISKSSSGIIDQPLPSPSSSLWQIEPVTNAPYFVENRIDIRGILEPLIWVTEKLDDDELGPPVLNPLIPPRLRPARPIVERRSSDGSARYFYLEQKNTEDVLQLSATGRETNGETTWREFVTLSPEKTFRGQENSGGTWEERALAMIVGKDWKLWHAGPVSHEVVRLPLPMVSPEPSCRCSFVVQLLSKRPARSKVKQAAHAQLWLHSFDDAVIDLAELGAPAGLAYEASFNAYGLRICFRGISQTLPSYARRFCRRLVKHHMKLKEGSATILPSTLEAAISEANRIRSASPFRKRQIVVALRESTALDAAAEGMAFLNSCRGGIALAQGDLLPKEATKLLTELQNIFRRAQTIELIDTSAEPGQPELREILYKPFWKPSRSSSPCLIPGVPLVADACGRIQR